MKKNKIPFALRFIGWFFPKLEKIFPWLANRWFVNIFFTPVRYKVPPKELEIASQANQFTIDFEKKKVRVYEWGEGPVVLFVHGWMGRATQFRKFIPGYTEAGYKVISFDATGHGQSQGSKSHLLEFARIIKYLSDHYGGFLMVVGHSLGGVSVLHAINQGVHVEKLVMISSPTIASHIVEEFRKRLNASAKCEKYFHRYVLKKFGQPFEEYSASYAIEYIKEVELLIIHDQDDPEVSLDSPRKLKEKYPTARLILTKGLGHTRILKDEEVILSTLEFLKKHEFASADS